MWLQLTDGQEVQLLLQRDGSVVCSEDFRGQSIHQTRQVLVQDGRLKQRATVFTKLCSM